MGQIFFRRTSRKRGLSKRREMAAMAIEGKSGELAPQYERGHRRTRWGERRQSSQSHVVAGKRCHPPCLRRLCITAMAWKKRDVRLQPPRMSNARNQAACQQRVARKRFTTVPVHHTTQNCFTNNQIVRQRHLARQTRSSSQCGCGGGVWWGWGCVVGGCGGQAAGWCGGG